MEKEPGHRPKPIVSRAVADGPLVELLYDPASSETTFAVAWPDGRITLESSLELEGEERLVPYSGDNNLISTGCVLLPSGVGAFAGKESLVAKLRAYIHRYLDLDPFWEEIAAYYVLLSWVYDAFDELPYLRFRGDFGTGKTRALLTIGSVCYRPFFASGASTVSPIFHILDAFAGTLVLDEADFRFSDATAELTKILNSGNVRGLPVLRTMTNRHRELNPQAFRVYGPKLMSMRESFADRALESRFLTAETGGRSLRADVPIHLPKALRIEAQGLRNDLLAWRFAELRTTEPRPDRLMDDVSPRQNQTALALLSIIDDSQLRAEVRSMFGESDRRARTEAARSAEGVMVRALQDAFAEAARPFVTIAELTRRFMEYDGTPTRSVVSNKWVGWFVRERLRLSTTKAHGVYVVPVTEQPQLQKLLARFSSPDQLDIGPSLLSPA